ncbi:hypothetical protein PFJ02_10610 [Mycobacterium xenopi]|uniref:Uncharacterized protein n=2 Tax=Mycobacterium xenopi TaxID=1789 RepID=A0AAD1H1I6_MYCXE|nr:hypothetical protein [Mycobacterium xenopi]MDA3640218.1 hypothetical protein [Mycobacterium xenopi]MDA3662506.1 hypothetical protein [Mycobacterium xenopi]BBU22721.1 hypothetical protein MYXE_25110 [Mycobacterium xenopi]SPX92699.1 lipoprotein lppJ [Mycobacterium xenopi]
MTLMQRINRPIDDGGRFDWLRSPAARALVAAALAISLVFGGLFLSIGRLHSSPSDYLDHPAHPASDSQSKTEVVEPAKQIVGIARLLKPSAGYIVASRGVVYEPVGPVGVS